MALLLDLPLEGDSSPGGFLYECRWEWQIKVGTEWVNGACACMFIHFT